MSDAGISSEAPLAAAASLAGCCERLPDLGQRLAPVAVAVKLLYEPPTVAVPQLNRDDARLELKDVERVVAKVVASREIERHFP